ncbi:M23 family metallopeptidase [Kordiimonas sp. SCSIO 12603]|uniref:peptidoglycan DD-metalloendopeptidase family protein n=1 Tax=Kordiimonas sp. SCSIO 12603 TaxID=2829596 RepID=UPI002103CA86|nr:peptidoglycan DD-metalloendopeptidase family protein [Kordiimonas sp. SCSIO 12603]UTW57323.1 M23 family metallopeptidase [Kordiimonas sp. SCSIO 12603]
MTNELSFKEKFHSWRGKYFPERQLFLRSEGRVRFLTIGSYTQIGMSTALSGFLIWGSITTYAYLTRDLKLEEKNKTISTMSNQYQSLSSDFSALEVEVERRTKQLEERQKFLEEMAKKTGVVVDESTSLEVSDQEPQTIIPRSDEEKTSSLFQELLGSKPAAATEVATNIDRRKSLLTRLENAEAQQRNFANAMLAKLQADSSFIQETLKPTKLTTDDILTHMDGNADTYGMGGPYVPETGFSAVFEATDHKTFDDLNNEWLRLEMVTNALDSFPVGKPAEKYYVSSKFGRRRDPLKKTWANHPGLDLAGWPGTAIYATAPGKVVHAGWFGPYGRMVEIEHGNGFKTRYGHMRKLRVKKGEEVTVGTRVGDMGKTGRVTGTHLHYEIWFNGKVRDPAPFLKAANNVLKIQGRDEETSE